MLGEEEKEGRKVSAHIPDISTFPPFLPTADSALDAIWKWHHARRPREERWPRVLLHILAKKGRKRKGERLF